MMPKVLIVDDEAAIRRLVERTLSRRDYACQAVDSAAAARVHLAANSVDLVISDIRMPGESGLDLVAHVARDYPRAAIMMLTGMDDDEVLETVMAHGVDGYITKPFEKNQLLVSVHLALRHRALMIERGRHRQDLEDQVAERTRKLKRTVKELVAARQESQKAQALFKGLFANARFGIAICQPSPDGRDFHYVDVNPAAEKLDGVKRRNLLKRPVQDVFPAAEDLGMLGWARKVARSGQPEQHMVPIPRNGATEWRHYSLFSLASGEVVAFYTDETERIRAEHRLRDQIKFIQNLMESIPNPVFHKGTDGRFLGCNAAFADLMGRSKEALVGLTVEDVAPPDLAREYMAIDHELFAQGGLNRYETQVQAADGSRRDIILSKRALTDDSGAITGVVGVLVDISERKQAENALKESEAELRAITESAQDAIVKIDEGDRVTYWNKSAEAIFGYSAAEVMGTALHRLIAPSRFHTRTDEALAHFRRTGQGNGIGKVMEVTAKAKDGREFPVELSISGVQINGAWHAIGIVRDITERRRMEERILRKHRDLKAAKTDLEAQNHKLIEMHTVLQRTQQQTVQQEKMASIGQLAAGVAHEINNPTGFVSSNLKSLQDYLDDLFSLLKAYRELCLQLEASPAAKAEDTAIQAKLGEIDRIKADIDLEFLVSDTADLIRESREGTERIKKIVIDLKDFAHPGQHERMTADINRNLESVLNIVWNELKYKATVHKDLGDLPPVECYPQQLNQVFMNLLVNAGQAMETMGEIHIATRTRDEGVEIEIRDSGCGIPEENLKRIFDPFFTTKPVGKGTGLGLNVAYNIVKKHGGDIRAASRPGKGTTFTLRLPLVLPENDMPADGLATDEAGEDNVRHAS